ncbi:sugar ABC transporter substrate-binding protein [Faecalicatena contorta]|uniref:Monosaccharide ABC transporter substrate-binding protein, CUT2 family n=1 Tax=Faecalicatena contorta TaxID=39482 RepID=A0A315ZS06_9FIRM|nr:sugar ABC transporter substrate-binding protein [Faecalicatena contorta]PWJ47913.1 monosaccharide ABC transporter substrate-binding protein (CUT2 family) [Faecalicatena contorta]SUQ15676.1 monosaccharide ABC transporter substrate-binding protein, CUT2 family [Faecalicatena contorta]
MKRETKKWSALVLSIMMLMSLLAGCNGADKAEETDGDVQSGGKDYEITVVCMALNSDYWHMVEAGAKLAGKELGVTVDVVGPNAESDSASQINMVEDACNSGADAIVLAPNEPTSLVSAAKTVKNNDIPLVIIDARLDTDDESLYSCFIGTGNVAAGGEGGKYIASKLQKGDKVAIIRGLNGQSIHDQRANGAQEAMEEAGLKIVSVQPADSDRGKAVNVAENMLQSDPDIKAFYATNDDMALGALQAVESGGLKDVVIVGFDGTFNAMDSIADGKLTASVAQQPIEEGYQGVVNAVKLLDGESVEKEQSLDVVVLTEDNVADFRKNIEDLIEKSGVKLN